MRTLVIVAPVILILPGVVHLLGTAAYLQLAEPGDLPYNTTVQLR